MSYAQALEELYARGHELAPGSGAPETTRRKFDLDQMRILTGALDHPEHLFPSVLIAGTNGKGSTAATLASIATAAGYRVGLYTSPHLSRVNERIQLNGVPIADDDFARLFFQVDETATRLVGQGGLQQHPSFFETLTAVAFLYFAEQAVQLAVLEVGIGGRLDATNIVEPLLSIITDISLDHTEWLGDTIDAITREKAGILRPHGILITLPQHPEANQALGEVASALQVQGVSAAEYIPQQAFSADTPWRTPYSIQLDGQPVELTPPLAGSHQYRNVALAIAAAWQLRNSNSYNIGREHIAAGVRTTRWPARLELFPSTGSHPAVLLDVAHNPAGAWSLRSALRNYPGSGQRTLLFGCLRDKAFEEMAHILFPIFDRVVLTPVDSPRTAAAEDLLAVAQKVGVEAHTADTPQAGFAEALRQTPPEGLVVCAGSVYLAGAVRNLFATVGSLAGVAQDSLAIPR